jgi:hypothetical protein
MSLASNMLRNEWSRLCMPSYALLSIIFRSNNGAFIIKFWSFMLFRFQDDKSIFPIQSVYGLFAPRIVLILPTQKY